MKANPHKMISQSVPQGRLIIHKVYKTFGKLLSCYYRGKDLMVEYTVNDSAEIERDLAQNYELVEPLN